MELHFMATFPFGTMEATATNMSYEENKLTTTFHSEDTKEPWVNQLANVIGKFWDFNSSAMMQGWENMVGQIRIEDTVFKDCWPITVKFGDLALDDYVKSIDIEVVWRFTECL